MPRYRVTHTVTYDTIAPDQETADKFAAADRWAHLDLAQLVGIGVVIDTTADQLTDDA